MWGMDFFNQMQTSHIHAVLISSRPHCLSVHSSLLSFALTINALVFLRHTLCHIEMIERWFSWCNSLAKKWMLVAQLSMDLHVALESRHEALQRCHSSITDLPGSSSFPAWNEQEQWIRPWSLMTRAGKGEWVPFVCKPGTGCLDSQCKSDQKAFWKPWLLEAKMGNNTFLF